MKSHAKLHWSRVLVAVVCLALPGLARDKSRSVNAAAAQAEEAALRAVVEKFFAAYGKKDLAGVMALWSEKSPDFETTKQTLQEQFSTKDYGFGGLAISRVKAEEKNASLKVIVDFTAINPQSKQKREERLVRNIAFIKESSEWKVWRFVPAVNDLAELLVKAKSEEERTGLLKEEKELVTAEFVQSLIAQGNRAFIQGNYPLAVEVYKMTQHIAEQIDDKIGIARAVNNLGAVHREQGNYAQAMEHYQKSLSISEASGDKAGVARTLSNIGILHHSRGDYAQALEFHQKSLVVSEAAGDKEGIARASGNLGNILSSQGNYTQSLEYYHKALTQYDQLGDKARMATALNNIGFINYQQGNYVQALEYYQKGLALGEASGNKTGVAQTLDNIGSLYFSQGNYAQALEYFQKSLGMYETLGHKAGIADTLNRIGSVYYAQSSYLKALEYHQKSLAINEALGDKARIASSLNGIGLVHSSQGNYVQALENYQKSLAMSEAIGDKEGVLHSLNIIGIVHKSQGNYTQALVSYQKSLAMSEVLGNKERMALTMNNIGAVHLDRGNYLQALEDYQKSLALSNALGSKSGIAISLHSIGNVHNWQGNYTQALEYYQKSQAIYEALGDQDGIALTFGDVGVILYAQGQYVKALECYQKSLAISEALGRKEVIASMLNNIGRVHQSQGNYAQALEDYRKSLAMSETLGDKGAIAITLYNIGDMHNQQGRYDQAVGFAERATALARQVGSLDTLWRVRLIAGAAYHALNQPAQARQAFTEAINTVETLRTQVAGGEQEVQRFFENKLSPYLAMVDLLATENSPAEALTFAERAKARVLLDVLHSSRVNVSKALTSQEQEQERKSNNQLVSLNAQIYREKLRSQPDQARLAELDAQLQKVRLDYEAFQTNLYAAHPGLRTQRGEAQTLTLEQAGALLPDAKTALLEFVVAEDKTFLFVLTKNADAQTPAALKVFPIAIKQKELAKQTEQFRQQLAQPGSPVNKMARELFDLFFKDAHSLIQGKDKLIIVPDGPLWEMPFQALLSPRNRYLIQDHAIAYTPSLTVLREMIKLRQRKSSEAPTLLAVANPALGKEVVERRKVLMDDPLDPLPDAEKQVQRLGRFYGPRRSRIYVGAAATEGRVKAEAGQHAILHLATHGILNDRSPMYSHLVLAQTDEKDKEDGLLEAWEIMNMDLKADLAVLSACETARGRVGAGEGMIGLTWALFVAGVPTTVVSQWKVRSDSTAELMVEFHRLLQARDAKGSPRMSRAEALRQAALKLLGSNQYRHPFHWAGFVLVGDWR